jgi:hypothetical protein
MRTTALLTCILGLAIAFLAPMHGNAQVDRGSFSGTVTDVSGRALPSAHVTVRENARGIERDTVSNSVGTYSIPQLPVGTYSVTFAHEGFEQREFAAVVQTVGQTRTLNAMLTAAGVSQQIDVSSAPVPLNQSSDALGAEIERKQIRELPLNGRNWATLTALVPGAVDTGGSNQRTIRFAGRGLDDNNFTYDGIDATNVVNQAQQSFVRLAIPTDSVEEFRVDSMLFTAENGSTPGGQIAVASGAGTNAYHGNGFDFIRNDALDAREPIDRLNPTKPPFRLNQFGGSFGGPVVRDRTFFYVTYEGLRQSLGQTLPGFVPTASYRARVAAQSPSLIPVLDAYPAGSIAIDANQAEFVGEGKQKDQEDSGMVRVDHRFGERTTGYIRFNYDAAESEVPLGGNGGYLNDKQQVRSSPVNVPVELLHLFSDTLINEAKFGFNRGNVYTTNEPVLSQPYSIAVPSFTTLNSNQSKIGVGNSFSWIDTLTWVRGNHLLKFGGEVRRIQLNQGNSASGSASFASLDSFAANLVSSASYAARLPVNGLRKTQVYAFAQDEWKFRPNLTFNLGVRYSFYNRFHEVLGRAVPFDFTTCGPGGLCGAGAEFSKPNLLDVDPRVAVAWTPAALGGKTVIRSGFGIYHGDGQLDDQNLPINNEVQRYSLTSKTIPGLSFPVTRFLATAPGIVSPRDMNRRRKDSYVSQWGLSVQRALPHSLVGTLSYAGSKGTDLLTTSYVNLIDPATGMRPYGGFGQVEYRGNTNNSSYQAFVTSVQRSYSSGLLLAGTYTWSHEIDQDAAGGGDANFPQNPACLACERASGDFDARHVFSGNAIYELPFGRGRRYLARSGVARAVLGNWNVTTIVTTRSGLPVNVTIDRSSADSPAGYTINQRPDRVPGVPLAPVGGSSIQHWINSAAFSMPANGDYGNLGRNAVRGPGLWQTDVGVAKYIALSESAALQFRSEFFNVFNRAQYGLPLADVSSGTFGSIIGTANLGPIGTGTPRQIQLMLRLEF